MPYLLNLAKFLVWVLFFVIGDLIIRSILVFVLDSDFKQVHEFRELLVLRGFEGFILLILTRHELVSIFGCWNKFKKEMIISSLLFIALILGFYGSYHLSQSLGFDLLDDFISKPNSTHFDSELFIIAVIIGPLFEEYCFRGLLWKTLTNSISSMTLKFFSIFICSAPFVILHLNLDQSPTAQAPLILMWSTCAICTLILYEWRKSILCGFALHASANAVIYFGHLLIY